MDAIDRAHELLDDDDASAAEQVLRRYLREAPEDHVALGLLAVALHGQSADAEAEATIHRALELAPAHERAPLLLDGAEIALSLRQPATAAERLAEAVATGQLDPPELVETWLALAEAQLACGAYGPAQSAAELAIENSAQAHHPGDVACAHELLGDALHGLQQPAGADAAYARALALAVDDEQRARALLGRARVADEQDDLSSARKHAEAAMCAAQEAQDAELVADASEFLASLG